MRLKALAALLCVLLLGATLVNCGGGTTSVSSPAPSNTTSPSIATQPTTTTISAGQTATFTVVAMGSAPLTYQWQKNDVAIAGATSSTYTTPAVATADNGSTFRVVVSNSAGSVTSDAATLAVIGGPVAPSIKTQPANQMVVAGQAATFAVVATGSSPLSYQWQKNAVAISGATSATYTTPATTMADTGLQFRVITSNSAGRVISHAATLSVSSSPVAPSITAQPASQTVTVGQTATFAVVAKGTSPLSYQWQKNGALISGATSAAYSTPPATSADNGSSFRVLVSNSAGGVTSNTVTLTVRVPAKTDVLTYHNDNARTGQNLHETILTLENVNTTNFGKIGFYSVDGKVDAQPLYLFNMTVPGRGSHNILYVATEHDIVYAFDADTGAVLWQVSLLSPGETTSDARNCDQVAPEIGVTATPVVDRTSGPNGAIYVVAMSKNASGSYFQRLHALDAVTGAELFGGPKEIQASFPGAGDNSSGGRVIFDPKQYKERPGLLLLNGVVYTSWSSHCDIRPYTGWIIGYNKSTLAQSSVLNVTANGSDGAIWMSGAGPAADTAGNIYLLDGNGAFDITLNGQGFPSNGNFGNSVLKLSTVPRLAVADYFATFNTVAQSSIDADLGSGGALVLPDLIDGSGHLQHLMLGAGKDQHIYVVNRDAMGKFNPSINNIYQEIQGVFSSGVFAAPAYFNNTVYFGAVADRIKAFSIAKARLSLAPTGKTNNSFVYPGATPSISANGTSNAILWAVENASTAVLHAYNATNLSQELYNSNLAGSRDHFGTGNKFITPTIVNGKVYVGTTNGVAVFGLLR